MPRLLPHLAVAIAILPCALAAQSVRDTAPDFAISDSTTRLAADSVTTPGKFVRGKLANGAPFAGVVRQLRGDTLVLRQQGGGGALLVVPARSLRQLEVRRNPSLNSASVRAGMILGMLGGGVGYLAWCNKNRAACARDAQGDPYRDPNRDPYCDREDDRYAIGSLFVTAGTLIGGGLAYALTPPTWRRVGVSVGAAVAPAADGGAAASVGARVPFAAFSNRR